MERAQQVLASTDCDGGSAKTAWRPDFIVILKCSVPQFGKFFQFPCPDSDVVLSSFVLQTPPRGYGLVPRSQRTYSCRKVRRSRTKGPMYLLHCAHSRLRFEVPSEIPLRPAPYCVSDRSADTCFGTKISIEIDTRAFSARLTIKSLRPFSPQISGGPSFALEMTWVASLLAREPLRSKPQRLRIYCQRGATR